MKSGSQQSSNRNNSGLAMASNPAGTPNGADSQEQMHGLGGGLMTNSPAYNGNANLSNRNNSAQGNNYRNENILCAVLALLKELDESGLELVKRDIDRKLFNKKQPGKV